ncbi:Hypothetical protein BQ3484_68 [Cedratvirus A11]|uniref:Uncharacterized protein n=1 Tax=Cedratvirus A11 TaxID=1903266 RepID=A0A1M7XTW7_9VIRU|nr:Hypothetical protein BQ3484_68 [Cedratvirus A11]SHO33136.1 Hypothetical protein BQ3484_68 [Cedratvirus A11]
MCSCEAQDLFTLSSLCTETRAIFTSKAFWRERFSLLGIQHEKPSLEVYLRWLKIERKLPLMHSHAFFCIEIDLELARKFAKSQTVKELIANIDRAEREGRPGKYDYFLTELKLMLSSQVLVQLREDGYAFSYNTTMKSLPLDKLSKTKVLNVLLRLCPNL